MDVSSPLKTRRFYETLSLCDSFSPVLRHTKDNNNAPLSSDNVILLMLGEEARTECAIVRHSTMADTSRNYAHNYMVLSVWTNAAADGSAQCSEKDGEITFSVHPH